MKAAQVIGVDIEERNIKNCKKSFQRENLKYLVADLNSYETPAKFDKIILSNVLEHIEDRIELLRHLAKYADTILLRVPMITRDWVTVYKKNMRLEYKLDDTHFIEFTLKELRTFASQFDKGAIEVLTVEGSLKRRSAIGGTARKRVEKRLAVLEKALQREANW